MCCPAPGAGNTGMSARQTRGVEAVVARLLMAAVADTSEQVRRTVLKVRAGCLAPAMQANQPCMRTAFSAPHPSALPALPGPLLASHPLTPTPPACPCARAATALAAPTALTRRPPRPPGAGGRVVAGRVPGAGRQPAAAVCGAQRRERRRARDGGQVGVWRSSVKPGIPGVFAGRWLALRCLACAACRRAAVSPAGRRSSSTPGCDGSFLNPRIWAITPYPPCRFPSGWWAGWLLGTPPMWRRR